jgi:excinuclease ABC subunit A
MVSETPKKITSKSHIIVRGARVHNLKNIDIALPRNKFIVITGLSGSGKSSLAFDTLYAEGQRRYVESLSSYARQFLGKIDKPDVDFIEGISPAIAIEQKVNSRNSRSTVGTSTEIYDYLKLLFARIGKTFSPISGKQVMRHTEKDVLTHISLLPEARKVMLLSPFVLKEGRNWPNQLQVLLQQGFSRIEYRGEVIRIEEALKQQTIPENETQILLLIDRFVATSEEDEQSRIADSIETAFYEGDGSCIVKSYDQEGAPAERLFSNKFEIDGMQFEEPNVHFFSFNNPIGACSTCEGFGSVIGIDENLVIPDKSLSVYENAIVCWRGEKMKKWLDKLIYAAAEFDFPIHKPIYELNEDQKQLLWAGNRHFKGLNHFFTYLEEKSYKIQYRVMLSRYRGKTTCPDCRGARLRKDANYVKVGNTSITDIVLMPIYRSLEFFEQLELDAFDEKVASRLLIEIKTRLSYLSDVGLNYLSMNRLSATLSGGESQRINLATSLGSSLVGSMYILDEPSIGLHPRDTQRLIKVLRSLQELGNTVIVVEHDEEIMNEADQIIDLGPEAGSLGGNLVFQGNREELKHDTKSLTAGYLNNRLKIPLPEKRRKISKFITIKGARQHNLKNITATLALNALTCVTGVSGSGKSSLIKNTLFPALRKRFGGYGEQTGLFDHLDGDVNLIKDVQFIDQNPIGKSSRSNPVTYVKAYDEIRNLYASSKLAKSRRLKPSHFSFNVDGGRCEQCKGEGEVKVEMQFMADIYLQCGECYGKRFKEEILEIKFEQQSIADLLEMTVDDAVAFFVSHEATHPYVKKVIEKLLPLQEVGLNYVQLGQSSNTLSGGEAQRIKLASYLGKGNRQEHTLFIFDEPTTGLHFHDINKLLKAFNALIDRGHSLVVIEHHSDVIKSADWVVDLGPEGGDKGGQILYEGDPEGLAACENSYTGQFLKEKLNVTANS